MNTRLLNAGPRLIRRTATLLSAGALVLTLVLLLSGCGSSSTSTSSAGTTAATSQGGGATVQVVMRNIAFDPATVTINVGDTVTWVNEDAPQHDVVADNGEFGSDLLDLGQSFSFTFTQTGTYPYHCTVHPGMKGTVVVQ